MTVCIITNNPIFNPQYLFNTIIIPQISFNLFLCKMWVPVRIQQATGGSNQSAFAVKINGTSFHNYPRIENRNILLFAYQRWNYIIQVEGRIFSTPGIIVPV